MLFKRHIIITVVIVLILSLIVYFQKRKFSASNIEELQQKTSDISSNNESVEKSSQVRLFLVEKVQFADVIDGLIGTVKGDTVELTFGGQEEKLIVVHAEVGETVEKGKCLFELDHVRPEARKRQAEIALNRVKDLLTAGGATLQDVQEAQATYDIARKDYEETFIHAPKRGSISEINKRVGETVNRNDVIAVLVSAQDRFYVETGVIEGQIDQVQKGQTVEIEMDALGNQKHMGRVLGVSREVTTTGRTGMVHISLPEYIQRRLRPGLSARCKIFVFDYKTIVIPRQAYDDVKRGVYAVSADRKAVFEPVELGHVTRDYYEVVRGIKPGEKIVADLITNPIETETPLTFGEDVMRYEPSAKKETN